MSTATMYAPERKKPLPPTGPAAVAMAVLGGKWTLPIIEQLTLAGKPMRFVAIQRALQVRGVGISTEQLRSRLNRMVEDGLLTRQHYREFPPRVDYDLTRQARELEPILRELGTWGRTNCTVDDTRVSVRSVRAS
jgi:DNA-binding HxlR family transcriptional regulator